MVGFAWKFKTLFQEFIFVLQPKLCATAAAVIPLLYRSRRRGSGSLKFASTFSSHISVNKLSLGSLLSHFWLQYFSQVISSLFLPPVVVLIDFISLWVWDERLASSKVAAAPRSIGGRAAIQYGKSPLMWSDKAETIDWMDCKIGFLLLTAKFRFFGSFKNEGHSLGQQ